MQPDAPAGKNQERDYFTKRKSKKCKEKRKKHHGISQPTQQHTPYSLFAAALGACAYPNTPKR
jgi:uncharacterized OsmC-like protein